MPDFLDHLDQLREEMAHPGRFGVDIRTQRRQANPRQARKVLEALALITAVERGDRLAEAALREVMTTSDFSSITGEIMNRTMRSAYAARTPIWNQIANPVTVADFKEVHSVTWGELAGILPTVKEQAAYPAVALGESDTSWSVAKHGVRVPFSWELAINDNMAALRQIPERMGRAARRSEDYFLTTLFVGTSGPLASVYSVGNANIVTGNPALSISALQTAFSVLGAMTDDAGNPVMIDAAVLVVPPALEIVAQNILNATQLIIGADSGDQRIQTNNWMQNRLRLVVDPYIPILATSNGNTSWFLFADAQADSGAIDFGRLRGREEPEIWVKSPNAIRVDGGAVDPMDGDFDTDTIQYRLRHVYGGAVVDAKYTVASNGSGS